MNKLSVWARYCLHRRALYALAWFLALILGGLRIYNGRQSFDEPERHDGNNGHTTIDFGGQWMMGRMLARGFGSELYSRPRQWEVAEQAYPHSDEDPDANVHDAQNLIPYFRGDDDPRWLEFGVGVAAVVGPANPFQQAANAIRYESAWTKPLPHELLHPTSGVGVGGPLYPPIHAFLMYPFALDDKPRQSYCVMQWLQTLYCFAAGLAVNYLSRGRFWWPVASSLILIYPGCRGAVDLGQNSPFTLAILVWGWACLARGRPTLGGVIWGLLAYKPVWAVSFFAVLLLLRQWRAALAMVVAGASLALATLPFVGVHSWMHWLTIGQEAAKIYNVDPNWVHLSRDVLNVPRRIMIDFNLPRRLERETPIALAVSWALWALIFEIALRVYALRGQRPTRFTGPFPAFLLLTAWMCTFHFMYYDALLSVFGACVLLADPRPFFRQRSLRATETDGGRRSIWLVNSFVLSVIVIMLVAENGLHLLNIEISFVALGQSRLIVGTSNLYPIDTLLAMTMWAWCALVTLGTSWSDNGDANSATQ
jgi:arabinofuranan 3-O-arabinosyltransferase